MVSSFSRLFSVWDVCNFHRIAVIVLATDIWEAKGPGLLTIRRGVALQGPMPLKISAWGSTPEFSRVASQFLVVNFHSCLVKQCKCKTSRISMFLSDSHNVQGLPTAGFKAHR